MTALASSPTRADYRLSFVHLLRSEAIKVLTLRSTWWSLGITAALSIAVSLLIAAAASDFQGFAAVNVVLMPTQFTMLVAGILGAIVITGEYSTGMIRSTLTAQPRRGAVLLAKAVVVSLVMAATTVVTYAAAIILTAPMLSTGIDWSDPAQSTVPLLFGVLSMVVFTLLGLGLGFAIRAGAGAIAATVGVLFVLPIVVSLFTFGGPNWQWLVELGAYLPSSAASELTTPGAEIGADLMTLLAWAAGPLVLGWVALRFRDA
ncbi:ABC-2 type transport system permease protein [Microbacterium sp. SORGH_AS 1204]|uniref:ABC transporter permease subunit n=1 Tax=Microbacterium sp. SORGH_AS_1204 TaxID=3041785 RepID=UPI0027932D19|nr:ABC transporter permease subunit [Microbacterium sp. SORGH_AS_1204]MDQ1136850.1 ABC-2 type transport system permease protein [Microbacterium sp. SORGH_AS_1204]